MLPHLDSARCKTGDCASMRFSFAFSGHFDCMSAMGMFNIERPLNCRKGQYGV
jgi:hypothetical protein